MAWNSDKTVVGASVSGSEWNTMVDVIEDNISTGTQTALDAKLPITLITPTSDHTYSGLVRSATAGEAVVIGDLCYLKSDGKFWKCDADAEATSKGMLSIATASISGDAIGVFLLYGFLRDDSWTWTVGADLYVSVTPGNPTETKPSGTGDIVRIIGQAYSADVLFFSPDNTYVELT
jgi:hypothetical protein